MPTYKELLQDPRWQKKRLEVVEYDKFKCRQCEAGDKTLHVHHKYYEHGLMPWEYPWHALVTFCFECHEKERREKAKWDARLIDAFRKRGATNGDIERFLLTTDDLAREVMGGFNLTYVEMLMDNEIQRERFNRGRLIAERAERTG